MVNDQWEELLYFYITHTKGIPEPVREYKFHPKRKWRADFAWPAYFLIAEVEGGIWNNGRHTRGTGFESDCEKYNEAACLGFTVLRFTPKHVKNGQSLNWIENFFKERK